MLISHSRLNGNKRVVPFQKIYIYIEFSLDIDVQQIECSQLDVSYQPLIYVGVLITFDSGLILNKKKNVTL